MNSPEISAMSRTVALPDSVTGLSEPRTDYPRDMTIANLFEEVVAQRSERIALTCGERSVSYDELNKRANQLAERLKGLDVGPETLVACVMDRSIEYVVAILGILKAGGAYLPIDPDYPAARIAYMLRDTAAELVLTDRTAGAFPATGAQVLSISEDVIEGEQAPSKLGNQLSPAGAKSLAYVMYTSGSTGEPKGVMVENRGVVRLVRNTNYCRFSADDTFLQLAPLSFDASTFEIWGALLNGSRLVIMPQGKVSMDEIADAIERQGITTMWLTAPLFHMMVEEKVGALARLRQLIAGGDVLSPRHVCSFLEAAPDTTLVNGYGPTENTTFTCCHVMRSGDAVPEPVPIGKPISNTRVYIVDDRFLPVAQGEAGELCAGGDGVARGYLNRPEETAAKFLADPFAHEPGQRLYRTGDRARWRTDGSIEFLGRLDGQVKVMGHRIEPGEIESVIRKDKDIQQVCVVPNTDDAGHKRLVAYYVPSALGATAEELRKRVAAELPQHMVPAFFVALNALPLSFNGKVDRDALAKRPLADQQHTKEGHVSGSTVESEIAGVWREVLRRQEIGLDANFFDLGGDSLLLVSVHSKLQKLLKREISLTDLFAWPTVRELARHLCDSASGPGERSNSNRRASEQREAFHRWRARRSAVDRE